MTADDLRAIAARAIHPVASEPDTYPGRPWPGLTGFHAHAADAHADRSALLALVRRVAEWNPEVEGDIDGDVFACCWNPTHHGHEPDCWWLLICQGARGEPQASEARESMEYAYQGKRSRSE